MRVISRKKLKAFYEERYPETKQPLEAWYYEVKHATWRSPADVTRTYSKARIVGKDRVVFEIMRNRFRLIVKVNYQAGIVYIRFIGTHAEYDHIDVETI
jgi:mRNA interferase HigB